MHEDLTAVNASNLGVATDDIIAIAFAERQSQYLTLCSLCVLVWDILITVGQEVDYIWKSKPHVTFIKVLYHLNRIWVPASFAVRSYRYFTTHPTAEVCLNLGMFVLWSVPINMLVIQAALATRVWALYDQDQVVGFFLVFLVGGSTLASSTVVGLGMKSVRAPKITPKNQASIVTNCNSISAPPPPNITSIYYCTLIVEVVLFLMMIYQVIRYNRSGTKAPLMTYIGRSGTVFFFLAMIGILFAIIGSHVTAINSPARTSNFITAMLSVNCSRLILSIRDACKVPFQSRFHSTAEVDMPQFAREYAYDPEILANGAAGNTTHELEGGVEEILA